MAVVFLFVILLVPTVAATGINAWMLYACWIFPHTALYHLAVDESDTSQRASLLRSARSFDTWNSRAASILMVIPTCILWILLVSVL